jgi:hypothetical protein
VRVDGDNAHAHAVLGQPPPVAQHGGPDIGQQAVNEHLARVDRFAASDDAVLQFDDVAVLAQEHVVGRAAGGDRDLPVGAHVPVLAVHRHDVLRFHDVVEQGQVAALGVARHVDVRDPLVDHVAPATRQAVDGPEHGVFIAWDQAGGQDDRVALPHVDVAVIARRHQRQGRVRLALAARGDDHQRGRVVVGDVLQRHLGLPVEVEVVQALGDVHVLHHGASHEHRPATHLGRGVQHLLDAMHVRREGGNHHQPGGLAHLLGQRVTDDPFGRHVARDVGVGGVGQQQVHAFVAQPSEVRQVRGSPSTGVWSSLKSPVCTTSPCGVRNANAQPSGMEWLTCTTSTTNGPCSIVSAGATSTIGGGSRSSHSSRIAFTNASVSFVP